jgi:DNA polymerase I
VINVKLVMPAHDELVLEVPSSELELVKREIPGLMTNVAKLNVPLVAEPGATGRRRISND